jgi:hypothetical protein
MVKAANVDNRVERSTKGNKRGSYTEPCGDLDNQGVIILVSSVRSLH